MTAPHSDDSDSAIQAITDPLQRALRLRVMTASHIPLTEAQSQMYREAIAALRGDGERKQIWIARKLQLSRQRIGQLLESKTTEGATA